MNLEFSFATHFDLHVVSPEKHRVLHLRLTVRAFVTSGLHILTSVSK